MKKKILVIDDDLTVLKFVERVLASNYSVKTLTMCPDIHEAVDIFRPDLIILDLMLPDCDGYELCSILKKGSFSQIPVILSTGIDVNAIRNNAVRVKADDFIIKPFDSAILLSKVEHFLNQSASELN